MIRAHCAAVCRPEFADVGIGIGRLMSALTAGPAEVLQHPDLANAATSL